MESGADFPATVAQAREAIDASTAEPDNAPKLLAAGNYSTLVLIHPEFPRGDHWFCDQSWLPLARKSLLTTSNAESASPAFVAYIEGLGRQIDRCAKCARIYHEEFEDFRAELHDTLGVAPEKLDQLAHLNSLRDQKRMLAAIARIEDAARTGATAVELQQSAAIVLVEALYAPPFLEDAERVAKVKKLIKIVEGVAGTTTNANAALALVVKSSLPPGIVKFLYDMDPMLHMWAKNTLTAAWQRQNNLSALSPMDHDGIESHGRASAPPETSTATSSANTKSTTPRSVTYIQFTGKLSRLALRYLTHMFEMASSLPQTDEQAVAFWFNCEFLFKAFTYDTYKTQLLEQDTHVVAQLRRSIFAVRPSNAASLHPMAGLFAYWLYLFPPPELTQMFYPTGLRDIARGLLEHPSTASSLKLETEALPSYDTSYRFRGAKAVMWTHTLARKLSGFADKKEASMIATVAARMLLKFVSTPTLVANHNALLGMHMTALQLLMETLEYQQPVSPPLIDSVQEHIRQEPQSLVAAHSSQILQMLDTTEKKIKRRALTVVTSSIKISVATTFGAGVAAFEQQQDTAAAAAAAAAASTSNGQSPLWEAANRLPRKLKSSQIAAEILASAERAPFLFFHEVRKGKRQSDTAANAAVKPMVKQLQTTLQFINEMDEDFIKQVLLSAATPVFLCCFSGAPDVAQLATDILCQCFDETGTRQDALRQMLRWDAKLTLHAFSRAVDTARSMGLFSVCPNLIRVATDVLACLYGAREGVIDEDVKKTFAAGDKNELLEYWRANWRFLTFTFQNTKPWGSLYVSGIMRDFLKAETYYTQGLLDNFRLFEADLPESVSSTMSKGEVLALDATATIESMCDVLRLKDEELLVPALKNIMTMIELMNSFKIRLPDSLKSVFLKYASQEIRNNMTRQDTEALLSAIGTPEDEIDRILDTANRGRSPPTSTPSPATSVSSVSSASSAAPPSSLKGSQPTLKTFFQPSDKAPEMSLPAQYKTSVEPSAPSRMSQMELVRQRLVDSRAGSAGAQAMQAAASKPIPKEVHPARPAGFNSRKPVRTTATAPDVSSDSEDEGLFEKPKTIEKKATRNILKENRGTPLLAPPPRVPTISDKEKEQQRMRQRLNINLNPLYKTVLSWNFHSSHAFPDKKRDYASVQDSFRSVAEYQKVLEPLLMLECWQGIQRAKAEGATRNTPFKVTIGKRVSVDSFTDIYASVLKSSVAEAGLTDADLIVLTYYQGASATARRPSQTQPYCMAKIKEISSANAEYFDLVLRTYEPVTLLPHLGQKYELHGLKITRYGGSLSAGPICLFSCCIFFFGFPSWLAQLQRLIQH